jgi:hypothetical protein
MEVTLYIGPGLGIGAILIVILVLLLVLVSLVVIAWTPIKKLYRKFFKRR